MRKKKDPDYDARLRDKLGRWLDAKKWRDLQKTKRKRRPRAYHEPFIDLLARSPRIKPAEAWERASKLFEANKNGYPRISAFAINVINYRIGQQGYGAYHRPKPDSFRRFLYRLKTGR